MGKEILVKTEDGHETKINAIEAFQIDEYPEKQYLAYTFVDGKADRVYISILEKHDDEFNLVGISDEKEFNKAKESFEELIQN